MTASDDSSAQQSIGSTPTDAEMLDFLDSMAVSVADMKTETAEPGRAVVYFAPYDGDRPPSLRQAIGLAMKKHAIDSEGTGYCRGCGTTVGEMHHSDCDCRKPSRQEQ